MAKMKQKARSSSRKKSVIPSDFLTLCWESPEAKPQGTKRSPRGLKSLPPTPKKHRQPDFSSTEQVAMLQYIVANNAYGRVGGNSLWQAMEKAEVCKGRSSHSMRNHYFKKLESVLHTFTKILTPEEIQRLRLRQPVEGLHSPDANTSNAESLNSSNVENTAVHTPNRRKVIRNENFRLPYSEEDDRKIIDYIRDTNGYELVKGKRFWERMAMKRLIKGRTWQALKERFRTRIFPILHTFGLDAETVKRFTDGWNHQIKTTPSPLAAKEPSQTVSPDEKTNQAGQDEPVKPKKRRGRPKKLVLNDSKNAP